MELEDPVKVKHVDTFSLSGHLGSFCSSVQYGNLFSCDQFPLKLSGAYRFIFFFGNFKLFKLLNHDWQITKLIKVKN